MNECPVSYISAEAAELVNILNRAEVVKETFGVSFYGGDLNKWPIRLVDAVSVFQDEKGKEHNERMRAFIREREIEK